MRNWKSLALAAVFAAGCGTSPPSRFYTLDAPTAGPASGVNGVGYTVIVGPVTVPDIVDRPQLVIRTAPHRVEIVEHARWAEPLRDAIPRLVAADLQARLPNARVAASTPALAAAADYRVAIAIETFDAAPGDAVSVDAVWTITMPPAPQSGRASVREPAGRTYEDVVEAYARALHRVSDDIAAAVSNARATGSGGR